MRSRDDRDELEEAVRLELYKSLRGEVVSYVEKIPALWLQKFVLVGGMIAFLVVQSEEIVGALGASRGHVLVVISFVAVPVLSLLLDAKILEYGLHARAVSGFIARELADDPVVAEWEDALWGDAGTEEVRRLVKLRSLTTVVVTAASTVLLMCLSGLVAATAFTPHQPLIIGGTVLASVLYLGATAYVSKRIWPREREEQAPNPAA